MQSTVKGNTLNVRLSLHWRSSCTGCLKLWGCTVQVCRKVPASPSTSHLLQSRAVVYLPEEKIPLCFYIPAFHSTVDRTVASQKHTDTLVLEHFRHSPYRRNKVELFLHCFVFFFCHLPLIQNNAEMATCLYYALWCLWQLLIGGRGAKPSSVFVTVAACVLCSLCSIFGSLPL